MNSLADPRRGPLPFLLMNTNDCTKGHRKATGSVLQTVPSLPDRTGRICRPAAVTDEEFNGHSAGEGGQTRSRGEQRVAAKRF